MFNLGTREENVKLHTKVVNVVNIVADSKPFSLGGDVVTPNDDSDQEDTLEWMSSLIDDSQQASSV